ncbi:zinc finger MYM-type protein 5-like [Heracleum sosnowskyi]|uniref:Zinc finger MYM-type protein 5-like n=1 Tax=Heracleum sosnowskyi TaxID=360622 RepID=A0AAD8IR44_9APIA|nr:zinc finger MYM-type protein 5-like [Heracleum sosnowskyi]
MSLRCRDVEHGIHADADDVLRRQEAFGMNTYRRPPTKGFFSFVMEALKDPTILILLGFGMKEDGPKEGWFLGSGKDNQYRMDKFLIKRPRFPSSTNTHVLNLNSAADSNAFIPDTNTPTQKRANIEFNPDSIISDPGGRIPIDEYDVNIRDQVRRAYIAKGHFRPVDYTFPKNGDSRTFQANWFGEFDWLEYNIHKDAAFCMWCYLFNPKRADNSGKNAFTTTGFKKWKKALNKFRSHIGLVGSSHNEATRRYHCTRLT